MKWKTQRTSQLKRAIVNWKISLKKFLRVPLGRDGDGNFARKDKRHGRQNERSNFCLIEVPEGMYGKKRRKNLCL